MLTFRWSGNWGPPMSHAANLGRLEIIKAMAAAAPRPARLDRAVLRKDRVRPLAARAWRKGAWHHHGRL
jgi:hypothetical protein